MKPFESLVHTSFAGALGWALLHSLWEGAIVAAALALALCFARSPRVRYACGTVAMIVILACAAITLIRMMPEPSRPFVTPTALPAPAPAASGISGAVSSHLKMSEIVPWLTPVWIFGVIVFYLRGLASWASARRLRTKGVCLAPEAWQRRLRALGDRLGVTGAVSLLESSIATVPVVIGFVSPVILTPVGMLAGMPASQI
ncbi:MAG TPA: hypothetical protein VG297_23515, partial [Bryobacteraceae bacterium]|nr:hypothetical protein [Bryobacteraceae bacterium]